MRIGSVLATTMFLLASAGCAANAQPETICQYWPPLQVSEDARAITIRGKLFRYEIEKKTGLMTSAKVMGDEFLASDARVPDLFVSPESDCRKVRYEAKHSPKTDVRIVPIHRDRVVITAKGRYADADGKVFGMRFELTWRIEFDGFVKVEVKNVATADGAVRWICFNRARLNAKSIDFAATDTDLAKNWSDGASLESTGPIALAGKDTPLFGGLALPYLHLGNRKTGIDFYQGRFHSMLGYKDGEQRRYGSGRDAMGFRYLATEVHERDGAFELQMMSIRDSWIPVKPGWTREDAFMFMLTPAKTMRMDLEQMRVYWLGPHQYRPRFQHPDEQKVRELARLGINVIVGGANYRSGDYSNPDNPEAVRRFIATCHKYGIRVIPYVTFSDLNHTLPVAKDHLEQWMCEPKKEFRYFTTLMCFGCKPWREHWRKQVTKLFEQYDFDGLYIDLWTSTLACVNERHGCDSRVMTYNIEGLREFGRIAREVISRDRDDRFILANVGKNIWSAFCGVIDARLVGENTRFADTAPEMRQLMMSSHRQGCQTVLLTRHLSRDTLVSFSLAFNAPYRLTPRDFRQAQRSQNLGILPYWNIFRTFGVDRARRFNALAEPNVLAATAADCHITAWTRDGRALLSLATLAEKPVATKLLIADAAKLGLASPKYRVLDVLKETFLDEAGVTLEQLGAMEFTVDSKAPTLLLLTPMDGPPTVLPTGTDGLRNVAWDVEGKTLTAEVAGIEGTSVRLIVETRRPLKSATLGGKNLTGPKMPASDMTVFTALLPADRRLKLVFEK